jgi:hypothetical protein
MCCSADHSGSIGVSCPTTRIIDKKVSPVRNQGDHDKRSSGQLQSSHRAFLDFLPPCQRFCLVCDDRRFGKPAGKREEKRESDLTINSRTNLEDSAALKADTLKADPPSSGSLRELRRDKETEISEARRPPSRPSAVRRNCSRLEEVITPQLIRNLPLTHPPGFPSMSSIPMNSIVEDLRFGKPGSRLYFLTFGRRVAELL